LDTPLADTLEHNGGGRLRSGIALRLVTGKPIVLVDQLGRMAGLCGDD
jgi:hypothetical protein